jgi:hypothetical protein
VNERAHASEPKPKSSQETSDFDVLNLDLSLRVTPRTAPNPLRDARPDRLEQVRRAVRRIIAAQRAGVAPREH